MAVMAKETGETFSNVPIGLHPAIAVDVVDLGEQKTPYKIEKGVHAGEDKYTHQITIVWQVFPEDETGEVLRRNDGQPHLLSKFYNLSLSEKANLRKDLDSWRGKPFTEDQLKDGWDVELVIGAQCNLNVITNPKNAEKVIVANVLPRGRKDPELKAEPYVREMLRPGGKDVRSPKAQPGQEGGSATKQAPQQQQEEDEEDFDLPF